MCAMTSYERLRHTVLGEMDEWVGYPEACRLLGMTGYELAGLRRRLPEFAEKFAWVERSSKYYMSIFTIWSETRWVLTGDICRTFDVNESTADEWIRRYRLMRVERRPFRRNKRCCPLEDVLRMKLRMKVKDLVGHIRTPWDEVEAWTLMGPDAVMREGARRAIDEMGEYVID